MSSITPDTLLSQLKWRYATKAFDSTKKIDQETWSAIEDSLVLTPSSFGLQPWHFFVIKSDQIRAELLPHSWGQEQVTQCSHFLVITSKTSMTEAEIDEFLTKTVEIRGGDLSALDGYRQMMVGFTERMDDHAKIAWAKMQCYIALGQAMETAALLGIDACPMEGIIPAEYDRILGLSEKGLTTTVACAFGYRCPDDKYASAPKVRFDKKDVLTTL